MTTVDWPPIQLSFIKLSFWKLLGPLHFQWWTMKTNSIFMYNNKSDDSKCAQEKSTSTLLSYIFSKTLICHVRKSIMTNVHIHFGMRLNRLSILVAMFFLSLRWLRKILKLLIKYNHTKCIFTDCNISNKKNNFLLIININCY